MGQDACGSVPSLTGPQTPSGPLAFSAALQELQPEQSTLLSQQTPSMQYLLAHSLRSLHGAPLLFGPGGGDGGGGLKPPGSPQYPYMLHLEPGHWFELTVSLHHSVLH